MILDLGAHPECELEVRSGIRLELAKVGSWVISVGSGKFISGSEWISQSWSRFMVSFVTGV